MRYKFVVAMLLFSVVASAQEPFNIEGPDPVRAASNDGEWIRSDQLRGGVVVINMVSRYTEKESYFVSWKLGTRLRDGDFRMITIIDFIGIPRWGFIYNIARKRILKETTQSNEELKKKNIAPIKYICDMKEELRGKLQPNAQPQKHVDIYILDKAGVLRGHFDGAREIDQAIALIDHLTER
jgi:hypothetical protein